MNVKPIEEIRALVEKIAKELDVEIVDVEFKQGKNPALTVYADTATGIDLDTCEKLHRALDEPLDELDPTYGAPYTLNVSSPGLDRALKTEKDFARVLNEKVELKLFAPVKGKKFYTGVLTNYDKNSVTVRVNEKGKEEEYKFNLTQVAKINRAIEFE
jgi:ribosome maturation factor RimP